MPLFDHYYPAWSLPERAREREYNFGWPSSSSLHHAWPAYRRSPVSHAHPFYGYEDRFSGNPYARYPGSHPCKPTHEDCRRPRGAAEHQPRAGPPAGDGERVVPMTDGALARPIPVRITPAAAAVAPHPSGALKAAPTGAAAKDAASHSSSERAGKLAIGSCDEETMKQAVPVRRNKEGACDHELLERLKLVDATRDTSRKQRPIASASATASQHRPAAAAAAADAAASTGGTSQIQEAADKRGLGVATGAAPRSLASAPASAQKQRSPPTRSNAARTIQRWWRGWKVWGQQREALQTLRRALRLEREASALLAKHLTSSSSGRTLTWKQSVEVSEQAMKVVLLLDGLVCHVPEFKAAKKRLTNSALSLQDQAQAAYSSVDAGRSDAPPAHESSPLAAAPEPASEGVGHSNGPAGMEAVKTLSGAAADPGSADSDSSDAPANADQAQAAPVSAVPAAAAGPIETDAGCSEACKAAAATADADQLAGSTAGTEELATEASHRDSSCNPEQPEQPGTVDDVTVRNDGAAAAGAAQTGGQVCSCCCHCSAAASAKRASGTGRHEGSQAEPAVKLMLMFIKDPTPASAA